MVFILALCQTTSKYYCVYSAELRKKKGSWSPCEPEWWPDWIHHGPPLFAQKSTATWPEVLHQEVQLLFKVILHSISSCWWLPGLKCLSDEEWSSADCVSQFSRIRKGFYYSKIISKILTWYTVLIWSSWASLCIYLSWHWAAAQVSTQPMQRLGYCMAYNSWK